MKSARAKSLLATGKTPKEVAELLDDVSYQQALKYKKELVKDQEANLLGEVVSAQPEHLQIIKDNLPEIADVVDGVSGLQLLDTKFHSVMIKALDKVGGFLDRDDLKVTEWVAITNSLSGAYNNIFNNKGVNVNVNNGTQFSDTKLSMFKGSMRG